MPSVFREERLHPRLAADSNAYCNSDTDGHRNCHANIDPNCHGNWESDSNTQTNAHCETPCDTEAAADSAAKAYAVTGQCRLSVVRGTDKRIMINGRQDSDPR